MLDKTIGHAAPLILLLLLLLTLAPQSGFKHCPVFQGWYPTKLAVPREEKDLFWETAKENGLEKLCEGI